MKHCVRDDGRRAVRGILLGVLLGLEVWGLLLGVKLCVLYL